MEIKMTIKIENILDRSFHDINIVNLGLDIT